MYRDTRTAMDPKPSLLRNILLRVFLFCLLAIGIRFAYIVTLRGESCDLGDFCFFSLPENLNGLITTTAVSSSSSSAVAVTDAVKSAPSRSNAVNFYSSVFHDLLADGFLSPHSKSLCVETPTGDDVVALKQIGVEDSIGISKKASKPLVVSGRASRMPFDSNTFDFIFYGGGRIDKLAEQAEFAAEACRTLKPQGFLVVHTASKDTYSFYSFIDLFNCCILVRTRDVVKNLHEFVLKKENGIVRPSRVDNDNKCSVPGYKRELVENAEPLIAEEPLKPWITLKRNLKNIKYLASMVDIGFKRRYVYVDVGSRSYGSSIVSWFKKQYPKQNKTFEIYAIEADKAFHGEYRYKKGVTLLPYAAWLRNETLFFEVNQDPGREKEEKERGRGMGRIKPVQSSGGKVSGNVNKIQGFDFANWLKSTVTEKDFVVVKMDVEGTEFDLIPPLFKTGAICLIDEIFLECHYNRWQKCCPGERSPKYEKTYGQCMELFTSLRNSGVLVHQWW